MKMEDIIKKKHGSKSCFLSFNTQLRVFVKLHCISVKQMATRKHSNAFNHAIYQQSRTEGKKYINKNSFVIYFSWNPTIPFRSRKAKSITVLLVQQA